MFSLSLGALCPNPAMAFEGTTVIAAAAAADVPMKPLLESLLVGFILCDLIVIGRPDPGFKSGLTLKFMVNIQNSKTENLYFEVAQLICKLPVIHKRSSKSYY
jgi:hypothetical protein